MSNLEIVPPPPMPPTYDDAIRAGFPEYLRPQRADRSFRCARCWKMRQAGTLTAWVPDEVQPGDPAWAVAEAARRNAFNGDFSMWCEKCVKRLPAAPKIAIPSGRPSKPEYSALGVSVWLSVGLIGAIGLALIFIIGAAQ